MSPRIGMDAGVVRQASAAIENAAGELDRLMGRTDGLVNAVGESWRGDDAAIFRDSWAQRHRPALMRLGVALHAYAKVAATNAAAQDNTSGAESLHRGFPGGSSHTGADRWSPVLDGIAVGGGLVLTLTDRFLPKDVGRYPKSWTRLMAAQGAFTSLPADALRYKQWGIVHDLNDLRGVIGAAGLVSDVVSYASDAATVYQDVRSGDYIGAGLDTGTGVASYLKGPTMLGYVAGVALQTWVQVGEAARQVDWSPQGMREIESASPREWVDAFGEAATEMPSQMYTILKFW